MFKLVYVIRKRADISEKDFHEYWLNKHGPLVRSFAKSMRAKKYVQSHTVSEDAGKAIRATRPKMKETYDGITEVWWDSLEDFSDRRRQRRPPGGPRTARRRIEVHRFRALIDLLHRRTRNLRLHKVAARVSVRLLPRPLLHGRGGRTQRGR